ncbi:MAG: TetR/AcrR family transcriptional regulator [Anaerolineae bacterium]|nr:TetR/AcrR family transcriptional regulator [Anaerolineae bacterium]
MSRSTNRRERRIEARKAQILDAAARVFAEKGFHAATTREIAEAADLSEGSIYNYFESKRDLLLAIADRIIRQALEQVLVRLERLNDDTEAYVATLLQSLLDFIAHNQTFVKVLGVEILIDEELRGRFLSQVVEPILLNGARYLRDFVARDKARACRAEIVVPAVLGSLIVLAGLRTQVSEVLAGISDDELVKELTRLYVHGLGPRVEVAV